MALSDAYPLAEARNVLLAMTVDEPVMIKGDRQAIYKIVGILLDNAIRYSKSGGTVEMRIAGNGNAGAIEVVDFGPGIPENAMPFIYDRFFRAAPPSIEGTGLGLAIAKGDRRSSRFSAFASEPQTPRP